ncbi:MAG: hypothetical protein VYC34_10545 [Planctomycetota bacterium]|nr:hypothetical protein [Planctomycetota bacterium]
MADALRGRTPWKRATCSALLVTLPFAAVVWTIIALDAFPQTRGAADQDKFHLVAIRQFIAEWPKFDVTDYASATTPGYHILIATVGRLISDDLLALRLAGSMFGVGLVFTFGTLMARRTSMREGAALAAPLACSMFIVSAGAWLLTDNAGWWGVLGIMSIAFFARVRARSLALGGLALLALVAIRQIHLWAAAMVWLAAFLGSPVEAEDGMEARGERRLVSRLSRSAVAAVATLPAFLFVGWFVKTWGGLAPPTFQTPYATTKGSLVTGGNPATVGTVLALAGIFGVFFLGYAWPAARARLAMARGWWGVIGVFTLLAFLACAIPVTTYSHAEGRWTGIWDVVRRTPIVMDRSLFLIGAATVGGAMLGLWFTALRDRDRWMFLGSFVAFLAAQAASALAWQRYYEPFLVMLFAIAAARLRDGDERNAAAGLARRIPRWAWYGPAALAALLGGVTIVAFVF